MSGTRTQLSPPQLTGPLILVEFQQQPLLAATWTKYMGYRRKVVSLEARHRCCRDLITGAFLLIDANRVAAEKITLLFGVPAFWEGDEWCWDVAQSGRSIAVWICECVS